MFSLSAMKILSWNVRGLNASDKRQRIRQLLDSLHTNIILLQETKLNEESFDKIIASWKKWKAYHMPGQGEGLSYARSGCI